MREQKRKKKSAHTQKNTRTCVANVYCLSLLLSVFNRTREWLFSLYHTLFFSFLFFFIHWLDFTILVFHIALHTIPAFHKFCLLISSHIYLHFYVTVRCVLFYIVSISFILLIIFFFVWACLHTFHDSLFV